MGVLLEPLLGSAPFNTTFHASPGASPPPSSTLRQASSLFDYYFPLLLCSLPSWPGGLAGSKRCLCSVQFAATHSHFVLPDCMDFATGSLGSPRAVSCEAGTQTEVEYSVEDQLSLEDQQKLSLGREVWDADDLARGGLDPERDTAFRPVRPLQLLAKAVLARRLETNSPDFLRVIAFARNIWVDNATSLLFPYRMKLLLWSALNSAFSPRSAHDFFSGEIRLA